MLRFYRRLAKPLQHWQPLLIVLAIVFASAFLGVLLFGSAALGELGLLALLLAFLLCLSLSLIGSFFAEDSPLPSGRIRRWFKQVWRWFLAIIISLILSVWLVLLLRTVAIFVRQHFFS